MRNLFIPIVVSLIIVACSTNSSKEQKKTFIKTVSEIKTIYPNVSNANKVIYNNDSIITKIIRTVNDYNDYIINIKYNKLNQISKLDIYFDSTLYVFKELKWFTDSLHIIKYEITDNDTVKESKETYIYNLNGEITEIIRYKEDSLGNWKRKGSKYEFIWENHNMINAKCYIPIENNNTDPINPDKEINKDEHMFELDNISNNLIKNGYKLYYESTYKYDNKNNPYNKISISSIILPNKTNISNNNPIKIEKKYVSGEVIKFTFDYKYNKNNYPTITNTKVTSNIDGYKEINYKKVFKY